LTAKTPLERIQENQKPLERLELMLPGFRGYKLREQRREANRIVRNYVYNALQQSRNDLTRCFQILSDNKVLELLEPTNRLLAILDRIAEKINRASYGYSGFFDSIKIEEPDLDRMLGYDSQLMDLAQKLSETTSALKGDLTQGKLENARNSEQSLGDALDALEKAFDQRESTIQGVKV
jgi:hypothetical protein